jgi:hypothetical protein
MPDKKMGGRTLPQSPEVATWTVVLCAVGFLAFTVLSMAVLFFYLKVSAPGAFSPVQQSSFPQPALQTQPREEFRNFERQQRAMLSGYGWIDKSNGLVRIPIEDAMRVIAGRGPHAYDPLEQPPTTVGSSGDTP